jgi:N-sulfoglucosamine sulfohydrolase
MKPIALLLFLAISANLSGAKGTNILFFLADDLTRWDIGCYGSPDSRTPTLDSLASGGMRFTKCYQAAPMCSPTRHNIYTGMYPTRTGAYPNHTYANKGTKSIVHYLKPLGYRIALSGKRHIGPLEVFPFEYLGNQSNPDFGKVDTFFQDVKRNDESFCLFLCSNEPHYPWNKGDASRFVRRDISLPPYYFDNEETRDAYCHYLAEINYLDDQVKQALELLDKHGFRENTVFIFAGEQGNAFPFAKWTCYNAGLGSALIVSWPGVVKPGSVSDALVEYSDICPTLIDIAGGAQVKGLDGSSLVPLLKGDKTRHKEYSYGIMTTRGIHNGSEYYPIRSVSNGTYRYILNLVPEMEFSSMARMPGWKEAAKTDPVAAALIQKLKYRPSVELFNDVDDPHNLHNLAGQEPYRSIQKKLAAQLEKWMVYADDDGLLTELQAFEHMKEYQNGDSLVVLTEFHQSRISGNLDVPVRGYYTFYISGEGSVYVDESFIVKGSPADDGTKATRYGIIALEEGLHRLDLQEKTEDTRLQWSGPGFHCTIINLDD